MDHLLIVANWLLPMLYLALLIDYGAAFFLRTRPRGGRWRLPAVWAPHAAFLVLLGVHAGRVAPADNFEVLTVVAVATAIVYWVVETASGEWRTGPFVLLAAFLMQYTASVFLPARWAGGGPSGRPAELHVVPSILAYAALTLSAVYGLLHLAARRGLKRRRFGLLFDRLPSLELLGKMNWHALLTGLVFLTVAVASGAAMYVAGRAPAGAPDAKVWTKMIVGGAAWVLYAVAAAGKRFGGWSSARVALLTVLGFLLVMAMLVASILLS